MKDINIVIDSQTHKVQFPDNFLGLNAENLQGNINFTFTNGFVNGIARLELSIDCESGFISNLQNTGDSYTLPILSSLLTSDNIVMQLVIEQTDLITYKLTTDTSINHQKTYYTRSGVEGEYVYTIVENPKVADIGTYYEAQIPIFKTHIFNMTVGESINAVNTIPDDYPTWIDTLNSLVGQVNAKIIEMNQALAEVDNLDITATKEGTTVTITITRKDGSQQVVTITDGKDGVGIEKIEKTGTNLLVDTYTIYYTDDSTSTFQVKNGRGIVSIDKTDTNILTDTYTITYNDNTTSTFYVVNGNGVESIVKTGTSGLIDTYRISYTNGEYYDYQVANGNGIDNIQKTSTSGLVDTYTITYTNGTTSTYIITNGNGISNIAKTSTVDNVDTYTIYYTNGTTSTFTVTNSTVTNQEFQELQRLVDYNALYSNALIKMNNTGTDLTINDTAETPMPMKLGANTEQASTTGKNLANVNNLSNISISSYKLTVVDNTIIIQDNTYANGATNSGKKLSALCPNLQVDDVVYLFFKTTSSVENKNIIYIGTTWTNGTSKTITQAMLDANVIFYGGYNETAVISEFMITKVNDDTYEPYTNGIPAPNPEFPETIHTISGDNEIKVEGKNLYDNTKDINPVYTASIATALENYKNNGMYAYGYAYNNEIRSNAQYFTSITPCESGVTYTIKNKTENPSIAIADRNISSIYFIDNNGNIISSSSSWIYTPYTHTATAEEKYIVCGINKLFKNDIQIERGTETTSLSLYQIPQTLPLNLGDLEYCKIGDYEDEFVIPSGKNLIIDKLLNANINSNGVIGSLTNNDLYIAKIISGETYTITSDDSVWAFYTDYPQMSSTSYNSQRYVGQNKTFIAPIDGYIAFRATSNYKYAQLEEGTEATPYEPYNNGKWYLKKNVGKVVLNGSENWVQHESSTGTLYRYWLRRTELTNVFIDILKATESNLINKVLCNNFSQVLFSNTSYGKFSINTTQGNEFILFNVDNSSITSVENWELWLNTHNTKVYYPLETPEYILLNDTLQSQLTEIYKWVKAYQDQTNISQVNNDLPFIINTITCYDLNKLLTRVEVLESEV